MVPYTAPSFEASAFNCPFCGAYSSQIWWSIIRHIPGYSSSEAINYLKIAQCNHCQKHTVWLNKFMLYPSSGNAPSPNSDLPDEIQQDYEEARSIVNQSPRGAAALLRLAIQKLCKHLGQSGENLNQDIGALVQQGLPVKVQQALDVVRVIGNEAVHPGQIGLNDNPQIAQSLFSLINMIAEKMITEPKEVDTLFSNLPDGTLAQIARRDSR